MSVRAKKSLGQHFLNNDAICLNIAEACPADESIKTVIEIGPGMGALTKHLIPIFDKRLKLIEIDEESVEYLDENFDLDVDQIIQHNFLKIDLKEAFDTPMAVVGNYPYNISTQILFQIFDNRDVVRASVGMFQKEVAERIASPPGNKKYGILSVLLQAFYDIEYLFTVDEHEFTPPPKVKSGVIRLIRNDVEDLGVDVAKFKQIVKLGFNQRRKTMRNSLKSMLNDDIKDNAIFNLRPEQCSVEQFKEITRLIG